MKRLLLAALTLSLLAAPARAAGAPPWRLTPAEQPPSLEAPKPRRDPALAAGLAVAGPLAVGLAGLALHQANPAWRLDGRWTALDATMVVMPLGLSAGYFYAGEPADGLLVGLFGSGAMAAGLYFSRGGTLAGTFDPAAAAVWPLLVGTGVALVAGAFAVSDVRELATQKNKER